MCNADTHVVTREKGYKDMEYEYHPIIIIIDGDGRVQNIDLLSFNKSKVTVGQSPDANDICIRNQFVSPESHGVFLLQNGRVYYSDQNRSYGSYVTTFRGESFLRGSDEKVELGNNSVIRIRDPRNPQRKALIWFMYMSPDEVMYRKPVNKDQLTIGRVSQNDIPLVHPSISRIHAFITRTADGVVIEDNNSTNGTLVNGKEIKGRQPLEDKDLIQISGFQLIYANQCVYYRKAMGGIGITAHNVEKIVGRGNEQKKILRNVNIEIKANEFVAIIGGSGAGKSTLMNVLNGFDRKYDGEVQVNNVSMKEHFQRIKGIIGYVPQEDIIYENLTLLGMLKYTAKLRMPKDSSQEEVDLQIQNVLETLDLVEHQNTMIRKMSGGQKKRASIAVELLADPKLFFLDEPTSGLDPGTEKNLMMSLKKLCKTQNRTIVMVTHTTQSLHLCDKVIFMGPGGRVCFMGNVEEAKKFFGNDDLTEIYNIISDNPEKWETLFQRISAKPAARNPGQVNISRYNRPKVPALRQFTTITSRYLELIINDRRKLLILLLEPILIGILLFIVTGDHVFDVFNTAKDGDVIIASSAYSQTKSIMFTLSCAAIWIGLFNSIQEICKERNILKREYMANLRLPIYISSKVFVQTLLGLIQSVLLTLTFLSLVLRFTNDGDVKLDHTGIETLFNGHGESLEIVLTVWITIIASMALGLVVSSMVKTGDKAMVIAPFMLIVQLLFSGFLFELKGIGEAISQITVSKWSVNCLCTIANIGDIEKQYHPVRRDREDGLFQWDPSAVIHSWEIMLIMAILCFVISALILRNISKDGR